jgi:DNA-binding transcriptional regulator YbjK
MGSVSGSGSARAMTRRKQADRRAESERGLVQAAADIITEQGVSAATFE